MDTCVGVGVTKEYNEFERNQLCESFYSPQWKYIFLVRYEGIGLDVPPNIT